MQGWQYAYKERLVYWYERYERRVSLLAFLTGFIVDNLTLTRIDLPFDNLVLLFHLSVVSLGILIVNLYDSGVWQGKFVSYLRPFAPFLIQFSFGGLFSGFFVFYTRSASWASSWLFLLVLGGLLIGNEFLRNRYLELNFHMSILFLGLFSYMIFIVPVLVGKMGGGVFLLSGIFSLLFILGFIYILQCLIPARISGAKQLLVKSIGGIFVAMNVLYFFNIIPPIPLSLKEAGVYHGVTHTPGGEYRADLERRSWWDRFETYPVIHIVRGQPVYVFTAVFAPTRLTTNIAHRWEYYNEDKNEWIVTSRIEFPVRGGRDEGYRGYSVKTNITPGFWRVYVETPRGQVLGRVQFRVEEVSASPPLENKTI